MEENRSFNFTSISPHLVKKRKLQDELSEMPSPKKVQSNAIDESMEESGSSNSFNFNADDDETNSDLHYPEMSYSDLPTSSSSMCYSDLPASSSSASSAATSSSTEQESLSLSTDCSNSNFSSSEHKKAGDDQGFIDPEFENMLYSNKVVPSCNNYVLSSKRWPVNQVSQQGSKKLTIDREFEQYFSKLML